MPLAPRPVQPVIDPAAADLGTMVDLGLAPVQPEPSPPEPPAAAATSTPQDGS